MTKSLDSASVLIIEDDENSILITQRLLQLAGVPHILAFRSAAETTSALREPVDLVLLDIQLQGEDGYSVARRLRQDARLAPVAIVALTANVLPDEVQRARAAGFDGLIGKPLDFDRFADQLQRLLNGQAIWQPR